MVSKCFGVVIYEVLIDVPNLGLAGLGLPETVRRLEAHTRLPSQTRPGGPAGMGCTSVPGWEGGGKDGALWHRS